MKVPEARTLVLADLEARGLLKSEEKLVHAVGHCYRCHTVIEPYLSEQWFVKMKPLAEKALRAWRDGDVAFFPKNMGKHLSALDGEHPRLVRFAPALVGDTGFPPSTAATAAPFWSSARTLSTARNAVPPTFIRTKMFSIHGSRAGSGPSALWAGPRTTADLRRYYPTSALVTGYDIIFFWVARMIMAGMEFTEKSPFSEVFIHGLIRDKQGRKMSKSLGNGIDPLEIVDEYGADALKFTLAYNCASGQDILLDRESFKMGSKFANKVWNASQLYPHESRRARTPERRPPHPQRRRPLDIAPSRRSGPAPRAPLSNPGASTTPPRPSIPTSGTTSVTGISKPPSFRPDRTIPPKRTGRPQSSSMCSKSRSELLHPFLPFVTEEIYGMLPNASGRLISASWPKGRRARAGAPVLAAEFESLRELVARGANPALPKFQIAPEVKMALEVKLDPSCTAADFLRRNADLAGLLVNGPAPRFLEAGAARPVGAVALVGRGFEAFARVRELVDVARLTAKLSKDAEKELSFAAPHQGEARKLRLYGLGARRGCGA